MCGASICQDRRFLSRAMPELTAFFHYRNLDVSSIKILGGLWQPEALEGVEKRRPAPGEDRHPCLDRRTQALPRNDVSFKLKR